MRIMLSLHLEMEMNALCRPRMLKAVDIMRMFFELICKFKALLRLLLCYSNVRFASRLQVPGGLG